MYKECIMRSNLKYPETPIPPEFVVDTSNYTENTYVDACDVYWEDEDYDGFDKCNCGVFETVNET